MSAFTIVALIWAITLLVTALWMAWEVHRAPVLEETEDGDWIIVEEPRR